MPEPFVRRDVRSFLDFLNALPGPKSHEAGIAEARAMMLKSRDVADLPVGELALVRDLSCRGPAGEIGLRLFDAQEKRAAGPLLMFFHGGGFVLGDLDTHAPFCAALARQLDLPVLAVDYRLAPEHPFPAGAEDCIAAARWAGEGPAALGREVSGLVMCGDSAGGNLAIVASLALRDEPAAVPVLAQWPIYPAADPAKGYPSYRDFADGYLLTRDGMDWFDRCYRPDGADWRYSPMVKSQEGMPPTLVLTASLDPIRDQGRAYAAALVAAGVTTVFREAEGNIHGFINLRKAIPSADADVRSAVEALKLLIEEAKAERTTTDRDCLPYRPGAGVMLVNREGKVFVAQRLDSTLEAWQMPQGGLDEGEEPEEGALRELEEETGIPRDKVEILARAPEPLLYDLPADLVGKLWKGKWRGQRQHWFLCRFLGDDGDVNIDTEHPEFRAWKWADPDDLPRMIVPFKRQLYEDVLGAFRAWL